MSTPKQPGFAMSATGWRACESVYDLLDGETFSETQPEVVAASPVPQRVTMRQARLALLGANLLTTVNSAIAGMPGAQGEAARIEWEYSQEVHRDKALVQSLAPVLGLDAAQLDALFLLASTL